MAIETLEDWNTRLGYCGCCEMPSCPVPEQDCQSLSGDASVNGFAPFVKPDGEPTDDVPTIYKTKTDTRGDRYTGSAWDYDAGTGAFSSTEVKYTVVANWSNILGEAQDITASFTINESLPEGGSCESFSGDGSAGDAPYPFDVSYDAGTETNTCEAAEWKVATNHTSTSGTEPNLVGCPGPFPDAKTIAWNYQWEEITDGAKLTDEETKEGLRTKADTDIPDSWPTTPTGTSCSASYVTSWPKIEDIGEWPDCPDGPPTASATTTLTKSRYRWKIPASHTGTYFKITWDIVFYPEGWDATIDDPDYVPPDPLPDPPPPIPQVPDPDATPPSFVSEDLTYEWTGGDRTSGWYEIDAPPEEGVSKVVNIRFICYRGPYGSKPQVTGEAYEPAA